MSINNLKEMLINLEQTKRLITLVFSLLFFFLMYKTKQNKWTEGKLKINTRRKERKQIIETEKIIVQNVFLSVLINPT